MGASSGRELEEADLVGNPVEKPAQLVVDGASVLDLYAGSGAVGLEALSRGAAHVLLVESDRGSAAVVTANIATVGLPALRLRGLFLAVSTLGFALAVASWLFYQDWLVHVSPETGSSLQLPRPRWLGIDFDEEDRYYWLCLGVLLVVTLMVYRLRRTGPGRAGYSDRSARISIDTASPLP